MNLIELLTQSIRSFFSTGSLGGIGGVGVAGGARVSSAAVDPSAVLNDLANSIGAVQSGSLIQNLTDQLQPPEVPAGSIAQDQNAAAVIGQAAGAAIQNALPDGISPSSPDVGPVSETGSENLATASETFSQASRTFSDAVNAMIRGDDRTDSGDGSGSLIGRIDALLRNASRLARSDYRDNPGRPGRSDLFRQMGRRLVSRVARRSAVSGRRSLRRSGFRPAFRGFGAGSQAASPVSGASSGPPSIGGQSPNAVPTAATVPNPAAGGMSSGGGAAGGGIGGVGAAGAGAGAAAGGGAVGGAAGGGGTGVPGGAAAGAAAGSGILVIGGILALVLAIVAATKALWELGKQGYETALRVADYNGSLSAAKAQLEVGRIMRDIGTANNLSGSGARFMESLNQLEENLRPITDFFQNMGLEFLTILTDVANSILENVIAIREYLWLLNPFAAVPLNGQDAKAAQQAAANAQGQAAPVGPNGIQHQGGGPFGGLMQMMENDLGGNQFRAPAAAPVAPPRPPIPPLNPLGGA